MNRNTFFLTFNIKKCQMIFVVGNFFSPKLKKSILTSQNAECSQRNTQQFLITQTLCELNIQQKSKNKDKLVLTFQVI